MNNCSITITNEYETTRFLKHAELDHYENGCGQDGVSTYFTEITFKHPTLAGLIKAIKEDFDVDGDAIELNASDEVGRLDLQRMENIKGDKATDAELAAFKNNEVKLWLCDYSTHIYHTTREGVDLEGVTK